MSYELFSKKLETISGITITPFDKETKEIDWDGVKANVDFIIEKGIEVIVPCGNTSEFYALTLDEVKKETKKTVEYANGRAIVMAGIGYSADTAIELGNHAKEVGADCVMIHMPTHPFITTEGATEYFKKIIEAVDLPSVLYFKNPHLNDQILYDLAPLEKLVGVKYAINDLPRFRKVVSNLPKEHNVTLICGTAEKWAPFFYNAGATGFTSGLVSLYPEKSLELLHALRNNDMETAWRVWDEIVTFEDLRERYNNGINVAVIKTAMEYVGLNAGVTREPVEMLSGQDKKEVEELVDRWGLRIREPQETQFK